MRRLNFLSEVAGVATLAMLMLSCGGQPANEVWYTTTDGVEKIMTFEEDLTQVVQGTFSQEDSICTISLPKGVKSIGDKSFWYFPTLTSITIPEGVESIGEEAFWNCTQLTSVTIGEGVERFESCAFQLCTSLTSITLPESTTHIGYMALGDCNELVYLYCKAETPPYLDPDALSTYDYEWCDLFMIDSLDAIYVPIESLEAYRNAPVWSYYKEYLYGYKFE